MISLTLSYYLLPCTEGIGLFCEDLQNIPTELDGSIPFVLNWNNSDKSNTLMFICWSYFDWVTEHPNNIDELANWHCREEWSFGPAHRDASERQRREQRENKNRAGTERAACAIIYVPLQRKMQSQLHKHHASTEWQRVLYTESLCSREGARERKVERETERGDRKIDKRERERKSEWKRQKEKRYKGP